MNQIHSFHEYVENNSIIGRRFMEFRQLQTFIQAAQLQSFSRAAEVLGYTQSAITVQIRLLEN